MTLIRPSLDYTGKDFDELLTRLRNIIPSAFPDWTDQQVADFGNLLVELFAYVGDVIGFYQDNQANESRWTTATLRRSLLSMAKFLNYKPKGLSAATAALLLQGNKPTAGTITIAAGDTFQTLEAATPLQFRALTDVVIPAGQNPPIVSVIVENSKAEEDYMLSSGTPNQEFLLNGYPYLDDSLTVTADDGNYTSVEDFLNSSATDRHFVVVVDETQRARVRFGDSVAGTIPSGSVFYTYASGGGLVGNVAKNSIRRANRSYYDSLGNPVIFTVTNPARASGGDDAQTTESIRELGPRSLRAPTRTVCREDYEIQALRVKGVARALMLSRDEIATIRDNQGTLYIVPSGGGFATGALLENVLQMIVVKYPKTITFKLAVLSAGYLAVDVVTRVHFARGSQPAVVARDIRANLTKFWAISATDGSRNENMDFGFYLDGAIAWSDVFNCIRDTQGLRKVDDGLGNLTLNGQADDLEVPLAMFPVLRSVVVIDALTGAQL